MQTVIISAVNDTAFMSLTAKIVHTVCDVNGLFVCAAVHDGGGSVDLPRQRGGPGAVPAFPVARLPALPQPRRLR